VSVSISDLIGDEAIDLSISMDSIQEARQFNLANVDFISNAEECFWRMIDL